MNFQSLPTYKPLRVLVINPLSSAAQLTITKMLSGSVFGVDQLIDLTLLVYANELETAEEMKLELHGCGFPCINSVEISSDLPNISDADVFCFITNLTNPNSVNFHNIDDSQFDALYLIIKIANGLSKPPPATEPEDYSIEKVTEAPMKPIIMADGVVTMNILIYFTKDTGRIPSDVFFCPTPLPTIAKSVLGDHFKLPTSAINEVLAWGANDVVFHLRIERPIVVYDKVEAQSDCDWDMIGRELTKSLNLDHTQFNASWMKKEFIEKVGVIASKNPYGSIYRASAFANTLKIVWKARSADEGTKTNASIGIISDGSLETMKGYAYVLPLVFSGDTWSVNTSFIETSHLQQEINRINKTVKKEKDVLISFCKRFLRDNVINQGFIPSSVGISSESTNSMTTSTTGSVAEHGDGTVTLQLARHHTF